MKKSLKFMTRSWELKGETSQWMARRLSVSPKPNKAQKEMVKLVRNFLG